MLFLRPVLASVLDQGPVAASCRQWRLISCVEVHSDLSLHFIHMSLGRFWNALAHIWAAAWQNKQNVLCAQRWLRSPWEIRLVWSESSLSALRNIGSIATYWAHRKDSDQPWPSLYHMSFGRFWNALAHIVVYINVYRGWPGVYYVMFIPWPGSIFRVTKGNLPFSSTILWL